MTDDRWQQVVEMAQANFDNVELVTEPLMVNTPDGIESQGTQDILEFKNGMGKFRLIRESKPVVLGKKLHYSHRPGDTARSEYTLSETEFSHKLFVYKEAEDGEWDEVSSDKLGL